MARRVLLILMCAGMVWAPSCADTSTLPTTANSSTTQTTTTSTSTTTPLPPYTAPFSMSSPDPEELVARIRALVRALRDADQLLKALQVFRDQQGDDAILSVMKNDANRTLLEQVRSAMQKKSIGGKKATSAVAERPQGKIATKVARLTSGKKSAKITRTGLPKETAIIPIKKEVPRVTSSTARPEVTTTPRANSTSDREPLLGRYRVVIKDLTPSASGALAPGQNGSAVLRDSRRSDMFLMIPPQWLVPPVFGSPPAAERGKVRFQDSLASPTSAATTPASRLPVTSKQEKVAKARSSTTNSTRSVPAKTPAKKAQQKKLPTATKASEPRKTASKAATIPAKTTSTKRVSTHRVAATLRTTSLPADQEEAAASKKTPHETPIIASIFPKYGPASEVEHVEKPFVPFGDPVVPSKILLPPLPKKENGSEQKSDAGKKRDDAGGAVKENVQLQPQEPQDVPRSYYLGETPWIPILPPASTRAPKEFFVKVKKLKADVTTTTTAAPAAPAKPVMQAIDQVPLKASPSETDASGVEFLSWKPSKEWQFSFPRVMRKQQPQNQRQDQDLQDLQQHVQSDAHLSVAETMYYRTQPAGEDGSVGSIPGIPGRDYPAYSRPPLTKFTCANFGRKGYFADPASGCQAFYVCHGDGRGEAMLCPNGTIFSQEVLVCDWWYNVNCK